MPPTARPPSGMTEMAVLHLNSALRRRGLAPREGTSPNSVTVEFGYRVVTIQLTDDGWTRAVSGQPGTSAIVARRGHEEGLARQLARELLDRLP